jgi:hypothetical protein
VGNPEIATRGNGLISKSGLRSGRFLSGAGPCCCRTDCPGNLQAGSVRDRPRHTRLLRTLRFPPREVPTGGTLPARPDSPPGARGRFPPPPESSRHGCGRSAPTLSTPAAATAAQPRPRPPRPVPASATSSFRLRMAISDHGTSDAIGAWPRHTHQRVMNKVPALTFRRIIARSA